jgi:2-dehydro-3-deoxygalactonokinase
MGASFIAGDWGTSHLRLFLCDAEGGVLDSQSGPGAADVGGRFAETFLDLTSGWDASQSGLPAVLCGMVGSNIGWSQAPYVACPAVPEDIADACVALRNGRVRIVPGLSCRNRFDAPDFLRGEETQILGAMTLASELRHGVHLLCLPGTHSKWVVISDGRVSEFLTAPTGELFALLRDYSVLVRKPPDLKTAFDGAAFRLALGRFNEFPQADVLHRLFECRSRPLSGEFATASADAYLSGLLIAADVAGALRALAPCIAARSVYLIGDANLTELYAQALGLRGYRATQWEGGPASLAGLAKVHRRLFQPVAVHGR